MEEKAVDRVFGTFNVNAPGFREAANA